MWDPGLDPKRRDVVNEKTGKIQMSSAYESVVSCSW